MKLTIDKSLIDGVKNKISEPTMNGNSGFMYFIYDFKSVLDIKLCRFLKPTPFR